MRLFPEEMGNQCYVRNGYLHDLCLAVERDDLEAFAKMIRRDPCLMWRRDNINYKIADYILQCHNRQFERQKKFLLYMRDVCQTSLIRKFNRIWTLEKIFERKETIFHIKNVKLLEFYITECCPNGFAILENRNYRGETLAHVAILRKDLHLLDYVLRNAPNITRLLNIKNWLNQTIFDRALYERRRYGDSTYWNYLHGKRVRKYRLMDEHKLITRIQSYLNEPYCLANLVLGVINQNTELIASRYVS